MTQETIGIPDYDDAAVARIHAFVEELTGGRIVRIERRRDDRGSGRCGSAVGVGQAGHPIRGRLVITASVPGQGNER